MVHSIANMAVAKIISKSSPCTRKQVGAIITRNGNMVSYGYNGSIDGKKCTSCIGPGCPIAQHAEESAIRWAEVKNERLTGCELFVTLSPCLRCAKIIVDVGIKSVTYLEEYRIVDGLEYLKANGVSAQRGELPCQV